MIFEVVYFHDVLDRRKRETHKSVSISNIDEHIYKRIRIKVG